MCNRFQLPQHDKILILWVASSNLADPHKMLLSPTTFLWEAQSSPGCRDASSTKQPLEEIPNIILWESATLQWAQQKSNSKLSKNGQRKHNLAEGPKHSETTSAQKPSHTDCSEAWTPQFLCHFQRWNVNDPDDLETNLNPNVWPTFIAQKQNWRRWNTEQNRGKVAL